MIFAGAVFLTLSISDFGTQTTWAQSETNQDTWQFEIAPYLFGAGLDGTVGLRGVEADIDVGFDELLERLNKGFMLFASARKGHWVFAFDGMYTDFEEEQVRSWQGPLGNTSTAQLKADMTQQVYALMVGRKVGGGQSSSLDLLGVARYTSLESGLNLAFTSDSLLPDGSRSVSGKFDWWDAAIGLRYLVPFAQKWDFVGYADLGAGGSDLTYQLLAGVNWRFSRHLAAKLGYRYLYQDYKKDDFKWDMAMNGVYLGLGIRF
jgi:opacity protein-like surface antigen